MTSLHTNEYEKIADNWFGTVDCSAQEALEYRKLRTIMFNMHRPLHDQIDKMAKESCRLQGHPGQWDHDDDSQWCGRCGSTIDHNIKVKRKSA